MLIKIISSSFIVLSFLLKMFENYNFVQIPFAILILRIGKLPFKRTGLHVVNKGHFSEAFLLKPRGGRSPPRGLNRKPRKNSLFSL